MIKVLLLALLLAGCAPKVITKEIPVEIKIPVNSPCVVDRPTEPTALRDLYPFPEWSRLSTDQRENLSQAQALARKVYGDRLTVATAGCN